MQKRLPMTRVERVNITRRLVDFVNSFGEAYASEKDRFTVDTDTGEVFLKGKPTRNVRFFPKKAFIKNKQLVNEFQRYADLNVKKTWRYWNFAFPDRKVEIDELRSDLRAFNDEIEARFDKLIRLKIFEPLITVIHIQYSHVTHNFHLHAHFICDVSDENYEEVHRKLGSGFSNSYFPVDPVRNPAGCVRYMLDGILDHRDMMLWPENALRAAWDLSISKAKLVRPCGSFQNWRSEEKRKRQASPEAIARRAKNENRRQTAYDGRHMPNGDRFLGMIQDYTSGGAKRVSLFETSADLTGMAEERPSRVSRGGNNKAIKSTAMGTTTPGRIRGTLKRGRRWWWRVWPYGRGGTSRRFVRPIRRRLVQEGSSVRAAPRIAKLLAARRKNFATGRPRVPNVAAPKR